MSHEQVKLVDFSYIQTLNQRQEQSECLTSQNNSIGTSAEEEGV